MPEPSKACEVLLHQYPVGITRNFVIQMRPLKVRWTPFFVGIPHEEKDQINPMLMHGPAGMIPALGMTFRYGKSVSDDGKWLTLYAPNAATPTLSYYLFCDQVPSRIVFGVHNGSPQHKADKLL
jgi:hypothetical protein